MSRPAKLGATVVGLLVLWMAFTMAFSHELIRPSATEPEAPEERVEITRTWYGEAMRVASAGLLGFFGVTLIAAAWRRPRDKAKDDGPRTPS